MNERTVKPEKVAFVTGASRGIGKAIAISLAKAGYDIVVTARTVTEGTGTVNTPFAADQRVVAVEGSIETTVARIEELGRRAMGIRLDILSREDIDRAVNQVIEQWGRVDVLVNNALYQGPGLMFPFAEFSDQQLQDSLSGILINQVYITRKLLPLMCRQGTGIVVCLSSGAALGPPPAAPDKGGWGFIYAAAKSAFHRLAEFVHVEYRQHGIKAFNVEPGYTVTESMRAMLGNGGELGGGAFTATTPEVTGEVVAWLCTEQEADKYLGQLISSPTFFSKR